MMNLSWLVWKERMLSRRQWLLCLSLFAIFILFLQMKQPIHTWRNKNFNEYLDYYNPPFFVYRADDFRQLTEEEKSNLSTLGRYLFLDEPLPIITTTNTYTILVYKYGKTIIPRHFYHFGSILHDPFENCSVRNCEVVYEDSYLQSADLVIMHMQRMRANDLPKRLRTDQFWAFLTDESPVNTFIDGRMRWSMFNDVFNWSMTYRMDSDIPVPYGRTVRRKKPLETNLKPWINKRRDVLITVLASDCGGKNNRWKFVAELQKHIAVDFYGGCGKLKCPGSYKKDCPLINDYMFYLAFENCNCREYYTEKVFWNAYHKHSIPIVMGHPTDYKKILPPESYINVADFATPKDLAMYVLYLNTTDGFDTYYKWMADFEVLQEHGYFQSASVHYCRACEALNYNSKAEKRYVNVEDFWNGKRDCVRGWRQ